MVYVVLRRRIHGQGLEGQSGVNSTMGHRLREIHSKRPQGSPASGNTFSKRHQGPPAMGNINSKHHPGQPAAGNTHSKRRKGSPAIGNPCSRMLGPGPGRGPGPRPGPGSGPGPGACSRRHQGPPTTGEYCVYFQ